MSRTARLLPVLNSALGEAEFDDDGSMADFRVPADAVAEVTCDRRLTGGGLVTATGADLAATLRDYGIDLGRV